MNLDEELRATLSHEAEMRTALPPDVDSLIRGGKVRRRRRNVARVGVVAASTVLIGTAYGVAQIDLSGPGPDPGVAGTPAQPSASATTPLPMPGGSRPDLEPGGTYRVFVGADAAGETIGADLTVEGPNWVGGDFALVSDHDGDAHAGFGVYQPHALADGTGCDDDQPTSGVGETPRDLVAQLARIPRSTVVAAPTPTQAFGNDALHLRLRVDVDCPGYYRLAETASGNRGITYPGEDDSIAKKVVIDFWVLDLGGAPVVVDQWHNSDASAELVDQAARARDSITFVTRE